jgi:hypothetical protein
MKHDALTAHHVQAGWQARQNKQGRVEGPNIMNSVPRCFEWLFFTTKAQRRKEKDRGRAVC